MPDRTLDRRVEFDERSRDFPIRARLAAAGRVSRTWYLREPYLDQGKDGACVGFGWSHELAASPVRVAGVTDQSAFKLYKQAQTLDSTPGEDYEGTSVLAGAKAVKADGYMPEYRWAFGLDDVLDTLSQYGPVVLGTNWLEGMFEPGADGYLDVSGPVAGGHCYLARGVAFRRGHVRIRNSWGESWGLNGDARIRFADLAKLLADQGEACVPVVRTQAQTMELEGEE